MPIAPRILEVQVPWAQIDPAEFVYVPWNLCCSYRYNVVGTLQINWQEFSLVQCNHCDLIWRNPLPGRTFNQTLYSEDYFKAETYPDEIRYQVGISDSSERGKDFRDRISRKVVEIWISFGISPSKGGRWFKDNLALMDKTNASRATFHWIVFEPTFSHS